MTPGQHKIHVEFTDHSSGKVFRTAQLSPEQLPETFAVSTTMHIDNEDWSVIEAIPTEASEFTASGKLKLQLRKLDKLEGKELLFTLPTVSGEFPETAEQGAFGNYTVSILEDDWRQWEFLKRSAKPVIEKEIAAVKNIWENHGRLIEGKFQVFTQCHARNQVGLPELRISLEALKKVLSADETGSLKTGSQFVKDGFVIRTDRSTFYGTAENGTVTHLCVGAMSEDSSKEIGAINAAFELVFVNWYNYQTREQ